MKIYLILFAATLLDILLLHSFFHVAIVVALFVLVIYRLVKNLGVKICITDMVAVVGCLIYLVVPVIAYHFYSAENYFTKLYDTAMPIEEIKYFNYALPATLLMIIGLSTSTIRQRKSDYELIQNCKVYLSDRKILGVLLIMLGLFSSAVIDMVPAVFRQLVYYSSQLTFIGILYLLHSKIEGKTWISIAALVLLVAQSAKTGMYGELVFWSIFGMMILTLGSQVGIVFKSSLLIFGAAMILLVQVVKQEYRQVMWSGSEKGSKPSAMFEIAKSRILDPASIITPNKLFALSTRVNQGFLVARAMDYVPKKEPFANGETIITSLAAAVLPRFVWHNKPEIGGRDMICRFLGDCNKLKYSYNIGQLGEGYVNFGVIGGAIFMFFYGWFIRLSYSIIANMSIRHATLILWLPLIFFTTLALETDFLTFINSFAKAIVFVALIYGGAKFTLNSIR